MPIVMVIQSPRDAAKKRNVVSGITEAVVLSYGVAPEQVQVYIHEVGEDNWAKAGVLGIDQARRYPAAEQPHDDVR